MTPIRSILAGSALALSTFAAQAITTLPALNVDTTDITVSGMSSGAAMAVQVRYADSATFKGVGVIAGSPYACQYHYVYTSCQNNSTISRLRRGSFRPPSFWQRMRSLGACQI